MWCVYLATRCSVEGQVAPVHLFRSPLKGRPWFRPGTLCELCPGLRVILISAVPEPEFEQAAMRVGALAFIPKKLFSAERVASLL